MRHSAFLLLAALAGALAFSAPARAEVPMADPTHDARRSQLRAYVAMFDQGERESLWNAMSPELRAEIATPYAIGELRRQLGSRRAVLSERTTVLPDGLVEYIRMARYEGLEEPVLERWAVDERLRLVGWHVQPADEAAASRFVDRVPAVRPRLPVDGAWRVLWGGADLADNRHVIYPDQRFAYDLVLAIDGATHVGDGDRNEDYHCFGRPVLAPAAGRVVTVVDDRRDHAPGESDAGRPLGNYVVIGHGGDEYAFLAQLRHGSARVAEGDTVRRGDPIAECGNTGDGTVPHVHVHLQTTPVPYAGEALPLRFERYLADGEPVESGAPRRGQTVEALP